MEFKKDFTSRQYMVTPDYEYFHYRDMSTTEVEYHNHDFYELYFFISGNVSYLVEGRSYKLKPWDILLVHNRELHKPIIQPGVIYERIVLWISPEYLVKNSLKNSDLTLCFESPSVRNHNFIRPDTETVNKLLSILEKIERSFSSMAFGSNILKDLYMMELMVFINRTFFEYHDTISDNDILSSEKINDIIEYINRNLEKNLHLDEISANFYISKYHLTREFKKFTGFTLYQFIKRKRLMKARELLKTGLYLSEIALSSGFSDYSNFIRSFKNTYGSPPKKFTKENF